MKCTHYNVFVGINSTSLVPRLGDSFLESEKSEINNFYQSSILPFVGIQSKFRLTGNLAFNVESQISFKGQKRNEIDYKERSLYFDLIPSVDVNLFKGLNFGIGGYVGIRAHSYFSEKFTVNLKEFQRSDWDYGAMVFVSYAFDRLMLRFSYFHGLNPVNKRLYNFGGGPSSTLVGKQYKVYQIDVGYRINKDN